MDDPSQPAVAVTVAVYRDDRLLRRDTIAHDVVKIGSDARSHVHIADELASRMHAVLEVTSPTDIRLVDLGNATGTLVNGKRVDRCTIGAGDRIQIGATIVVLEGAAFVTGAAGRRDAGVAFASETTYALAGSGRPVDPEEVETRQPAVEVVVLWGSTIVHVAHLAPPRPFWVGEDADCDCFIPVEALGSTRAPLIACDAGGDSLVLWPHAGGYVDTPGEGRSSFAELVASGRARSSTSEAGAHEHPLAAGAQALIELGMSLSIRVSAVRAGRRAPVGLMAPGEPEALVYTGLSFLLHAGMVAAFAFFLPGMAGDSGEAIDRDRVLTMQRLLDASADRERERSPEVDEARSDAREGGTGAVATGEAGSLGDRSSRAPANSRYGVKGPRDNPDPHLARLAALDEAERFGLIGYLSSMAGGDPDAPTARWGREDSLGKDDRSALGNVFGDTIADAAGAGGLDLTGPGEGGGGPGDGIGLRDFGGLDHGGGPGHDQGIGVGRGRPQGGHAVRSPRMRDLATTINGRLPPEVIQRIVRLNFGRFRFCYERGLRADPGLRGRVTVKFVIDRSGAVALTSDGGSDLRDRSVVQCVVAGFGELSFPPPEAGMVTVAYPILFEPGD